MMNDNKLNGGYDDSVVLTGVEGVPTSVAGVPTSSNDTLFANEYNRDVFTINDDDAIVTAKAENGLNNKPNNNNDNNKAPSGPTVTGVVVGTSAAVIGDTHRERISHSFMGCCCDCRRAVVAVNIINLVFAFIGLVGFIVVVASAGNSDNFDDIEIDDDYALAQYDLIKSFAPLVIVIILLTMIGFTMGIVGAIQFKIWMIIVAIVIYCITAIFELLSFSIIGLIITGLFAYPHFVLVHEIRRGIMTKESYPVEQQSCCCV